MYFITFFILSFSTIASIEGKLEIKSPNEKINLGDIVKGKMIIWPLEDKSTYWINGLEGKYVFDNALYITKILKYGFSQNNYDVLEVDFDLVLLQPVENNMTLLFDYENIKVPVKLVLSSSINQIDKPIESFVYINETFNKVYTSVEKLIYLSLLILFVILIVAMGSYLYFKKYLKKKRMKRRQELIEKVNTLSERSEIEDIVNIKTDLIKLSILGENDFKEIKDELDKIQYQENWNEDELKNILIVIKEKISRNDVRI